MGASVSSTKLVLPAVLALPAASVATALTVMVPLPRVVRSAAVSCTAMAVAPLPMTVLLTLLLPRVKVTLTVASCSAVRVTTPEAAVASACVAPPATPVPSAKTGAVGALVSTLCRAVKPVRMTMPAPSRWVSLPAGSRMVLPFRLSALLGTAMPSASVWPARMVYRNLRVEVPEPLR